MPNQAQDAVYVLTEFTGEVLHFSGDRPSGVLALRGSSAAFDTSAGLGHSRFGVDPRPNHLIWGADLHLGPGRLTLSTGTSKTDEMKPLKAPDLGQRLVTGQAVLSESGGGGAAGAHAGVPVTSAGIVRVHV